MHLRECMGRLFQDVYILYFLLFLRIQTATERERQIGLLVTALCIKISDTLY